MVCQTVTWGVFEGLVLMQFSLDDSMDDGSRQIFFYKHRSKLRKQQKTNPSPVGYIAWSARNAGFGTQT